MDNNWKKHFADLKNNQELVEHLNKGREREGRPRSERRAEAREQLLPKDRTCPLCLEVKLRSRQWVVTDEGARCKSCHMKLGNG
jgi:hypothetical protein